MEKQFLVFGDSITYGAIDREGGWANRLRAHLDTRMIDSNLQEFYMLYNLGVSGNTTRDLLARFEPELKARMDSSEEMIIVFAIGINDSQYVNGKVNNRVKPEEFKANIQKLYNKAKSYASHIVFVGLTNVEESRTMPVVWADGAFYDNETIKIYDEILGTFCGANDLTFIHMQDVLIKNDLADGLHPNTEGFEKMFGVIRAELEKAKII